MTYLDQPYEPDIYPPRPPGPAPRGRGIIGAMGFQSRRTQENEARKWQYYYEQQRVYAQKLAERQQREREQAAKEQERMEREHRAEQVKLAEQQAKLNESIAKQKYWQDELQKLERQTQEIQSARPKTSAQLATDKRQIGTAKKNLAKATEDLDNFARTMEPLMKEIRGKKLGEQSSRERFRRPGVGRLKETIPSMMAGVPFFSPTTENPEYTKYKQNEQKALDLLRGTSKATKGQGEPARPGFKSTYAAYEAAREGVPIAEEKLAEQQEKLQRADEEFQRTRMMPIEERRLAAERGLLDEAAKQQAAQQIIDAYQKGGAGGGEPQAPQGGVSGGNVQKGIGPMQSPFTPQPAPTQAQMPGSNAGGKGAVPIPIIGPILSAVGSALAGGKGAGGMMSPGRAQMPPRAPAGGFSPLSPSTVAPPLRFQPEQWFPLSPSPVAPPSQFQGPQMQAGQPPAIEQPAPGIQQASYEGQPYTYAESGGPQSAAGYGRDSGAPVVVGDSIALGLQQEMGAQGDSKQSRPPAEVLAAIQSNPKMFSGRDVILSSGASNDTKAIGLLAKQIEALKAAGAKSISVMGVGDRKDFRGLNEQLSKIAGSMGARFLGPLQNLSKDHVHARSYRNIINQIRRSPASPGAANDRGGAAIATRQRAAGSTAQPPVFTRMPNQFSINPVKAMADASAARYGIDPRILYGVVAGESGHGNRYDTNFKGERSYGPLQMNMAGGMGNVLARQGIDVTNPASLPKQFDWMAKYIAGGGSMSPWRGYVKPGGGPKNWNPSWGTMGALPGLGAQMPQMAAASPQVGASGPAGFARGSGRSFPAGQQPPQLPPQQARQAPQQPQKQVNPVAAGLSAIQPAKPTVEMTEPAPIPPLQQPQKTPFIPLPFVPEKATSMDHFAQAGLMSGLSREQVMALMKKTMPNDQLPAWLMQQQQPQQQDADAGE